MDETKSTPDTRSAGRRSFLKAGVLGVAAAAATPLISRSTVPRPATQPFNTAPPADPRGPSSELEEITITTLQNQMKSGQLTARSLAEEYLARIDQIDKHGPGVNAVIELNPDALSIALALDGERKIRGTRGPLHGIPVLIKDNIATRDRMQTTAGSLALVGSTPPKDSFVVKKLRDAGAVILGKTNLSEWANIRSSHSISGWSGRGGLTRNPCALDRNPCGSSSGSGAAVSANLCAVAIGTETDGSIVCPAQANGIVGIKPTVGLVSRAGIIPIAHSQDTAGPMARTVTDAAILLGVLTNMDADDPATIASQGRSLTDYTRFLDPNGLAGARIGVVRKLFGFSDAVDRLANEAIDAMQRAGAAIFDPADVPNLDHVGEHEMQVLLYELKADLNAYLAQLGSDAPVRSLEDVIAFNEKHPKEEMPYFGQDLFIKAQGKGSLFGKEYLDARAACQRLMRRDGIDAVMDKFKLDALVAPTGGPAWVTDLVDGDHDIGGSSTAAAVAGYPHISVPAGFVFGLPVGISFFGRAWTEPTLIKLAYAFEQATKHRRTPGFLPGATLNAP